ncbi:MAG: YdeI/OmpD-associated family protein [Alphaproteobacteria bacterium]|nr:YdeI/OmpD-associated family protein [Alphaproteobacteria bacterium]
MKKSEFNQMSGATLLSGHPAAGFECMSKEARTELPVRSFASEAAFEKWLDTNHTHSPGLWLRFFKKSAARKALAHKGALDVALCYGWIDGQLKKFDSSSYLHKFTPRGTRSVWSRVNRKHVERLTKESRMRPAGLAAVAAAKEDGRWDKAYDSSSSMKIPMDFLTALAEDEQAKAFFDTLNRANLYSITWRLQTARKPETRQKRMEAIVTMLGQKKKFH